MPRFAVPRPCDRISRRAGPALILLALLASGPTFHPAAARDAEPWDLGTDRDAFTPCTHTVAPGTILTEGSYVYIDNVVGYPTNNYPEWLLRVGGTEWLEWRFGVNYGVGSQGNVVTSVEVGEGAILGLMPYESSVLYGFKVNTSTQEGWMPESCFIMEASTPLQSEVLGTVPVATGVCGWELPVGLRRAKPCRIDTSLRYAYTERLLGRYSRWSPSAVLRVPVTERWEVHAEYFSSVSDLTRVTISQEYFSPGTHIMITKNFELGVRVGWALTRESAPFFSDAGFGWRW